MRELFTVAVVICASALICTIFSNFVTDGSTKKIVTLVLGAFMVCSMIMPIKNAVSGFEINMQEYQADESKAATNDEVYSRALISQTKINLENTLFDLLLQNGIEINKAEISLAETEENRIIISSICIYINKASISQSDNISRIVNDNFGIMPSILTE